MSEGKVVTLGWLMKSEGETVCGCLQIGSKSKAIENCYGLLFRLKPVT